MTTHVFIVTKETFPLHLKYMFAGTGAGYLSVDFNESSEDVAVPKNLVGMMADAARIRQGDKIIFYCMGSLGNGQFFGVFKAKDRSFVDSNSQSIPELPKKLTYRVLLEPDEVFSKGVTEWEALDSLEGVDKPCDILWSLIYRKLDGNRGNTMITPAESDRLIAMIREKNNNEIILSNGFNYAEGEQNIISCNQISYDNRYSKPIDIKCKLIHTHYVYEAFLQTYITQCIDKDQQLKSLFLNDRNLEWIGNEVVCGVGMRRIDILLMTKDNSSKTYLTPIELKDDKIRPQIVEQLERYMQWIKQYLKPSCDIIEPTIIVRKTVRKNKSYNNGIEALIRFNEKHNTKIRYIVYYIKDNDLIFEEINYSEPLNND